MSYRPNLGDPWWRVATYADKIFKGMKPADLPLEQPKKFVFIINLKAAKQIGLTIPPNVLVRADKVIKGFWIEEAKRWTNIGVTVLGSMLVLIVIPA
jgi:ABC transporter substrate binding protein